MFAQLWGAIGSFFRDHVARPFAAMNAWDVIDILLLAALMFVLYRYARNRRAGRVLVGLAVVCVFSAAVSLTELTALRYVVRLFASAFAFCFVLIFQPEIRTGLEKLGNSRLAAPMSDTLPRRQYPAAKQVTAETVDAVCRMSNTCTGALIVFEGLTRLGNYTEGGKLVDARVTSHLLQNIFYDKAPLHDGARSSAICASMRRAVSCPPRRATWISAAWAPGTGRRSESRRSAMRWSLWSRSRPELYRLRRAEGCCAAWTERR